MGATKQRAIKPDTKDVETKLEAVQASLNDFADDTAYSNISPTLPGGNGYGRARRDSAYGSTSTYNSATSPVGSFSMPGRTTDYSDHHMYGSSVEASPTLGIGGTDKFPTAQFEMYSPITTDQDGVIDNDLTNPDQDWPVLCLMPNCNARPFRLNADLKRHYNNAHPPNKQKDAFRCDYNMCPRTEEPFNRRDHFWEHLQTHHREDIMKRKKPIKQDWLESRHIQPNWWRCSKCLVRIPIPKHGYKCFKCNTPCETKRREYRKRIGGSNPPDSTPLTETPNEDQEMTLSQEPSAVSQTSTESPKLAPLARKPSKAEDSPKKPVKKLAPAKKPDASPKGAAQQRKKVAVKTEKVTGD